MAGVTLGFLKFVLGFDTVAFKKGMTQAERELVVLQKNFQKVGQGLTNLGRTMSLAVTAPILGMGAAALKMAANFETAMNDVSISTQATAEQMAVMKELALEIGKDTTKSASEAAGAMDMLAKAGMKTTDIIAGGAKATVALAEAAGSELEPAAAAVTDAMSQFDLTVADLPKIVNQITGAVNESKFAFDDFTLGMGQAGGVAASTGLDFEEFAAALAATSSQFTSGSDAGTSFKTFLQRLTPDTKKARAAMESAGFAAYDAAGRLKPLRDIAEQLQVQFGKMAEGDRSAKFEQMFGTDAVRTAIGLMKAGAKGIDEMTAKLAKTDAAAQAAQRMKGLNAELEKLRGSLETAAIKLADAGVATAVTNFVAKIGELVDAFAELDPKTRNTILTIAAFAAAIGPVMMILGPIVRLVGALLPHLVKLGPLFGGAAATAGPLGLTALPAIAAAIPPITAAVVLMVAAWNSAEDIPEIIDDINLGLKEAEGTAAHFGKQTWAEAFGEQLGYINQRLEEGQKGRDDLNAWVEEFRNRFHGSLASATLDFNLWHSNMVMKANKFKADVWNAITGGLDEAKKKIGDGLTWIKDKFQWLGDQLVWGSIVPDMVDAIGATMTRLETEMAAPVKKGADAVVQALTELKERGAALLRELYPETAARLDFEKDIAALKALKLSTEEYADARERLNRIPPPEPISFEGGPPASNADPWTPLEYRPPTIPPEVIAANDDALEKIAEATRDKTAEMADYWGQLGVAAVGHMKDMVTAFKSGDILGGIQHLLETVLQVVKLLASVGVFGGTGGVPSGGTGFSAGARGGFGGFRGAGGPVVPGKSYVVGENGPEWFSSKKRGFINPGREAQPTRVIVVPSPYFDTVVDHRAAAVAAPMAGQAAVIGVTGSEARAVRRSRRNLLAA